MVSGYFIGELDLGGEVQRFEHQVPMGVDPAIPPGMVQQHQGQEAHRFGLVGHQGDQGSGEADGLSAQPLAHEIGPGRRRVPLVEEEVEHGEHGPGAIHQLVGWGYPERNAGMPDLPLGSDQALRHGRLRHQERSGNLGGRHTGQRAQSQRHLGLERQGRVATGEHQPQLIVRHIAALADFRFIGCTQPGHLHQFLRPHRGPTQAIHGSIPRHRGQPGAGLTRYAVAGPSLQRRREGILHALLRDIPVANAPDQSGDHSPPLFPEGFGYGDFDLGRYISQIGLTSIEPSRAPGILAAISIASSRSLQSTR